VGFNGRDLTLVNAASYAPAGSGERGRSPQDVCATAQIWRSCNSHEEVLDGRRAMDSLIRCPYID